MSTARDYARFCQMMLNDGVLDERAPPAVGDGAHDDPQPTPRAGAHADAGGGARTDKGLGFGLGFAVRIAPESKNPASPAGEYFWGGAASTGFSICPKNDTVVVALTQFMPYKPTLSEAFIRGGPCGGRPARCAAPAR